mmetsp:Transcript_24505/g.80317  ORF Transcript_24505/g.80317 Transcript_24505/m.80317 type:complete len:96 (+) Transcript_24505:1043-1330(+)
MLSISSRDIKQWVAGPAEEGGNAVDITDMTIEDFVVQVRQSKPSVKTCATVCSVHKESEVGHAVKLLLRTGYHHVRVHLRVHYWLTLSPDADVGR